MKIAIIGGGVSGIITSICIEKKDAEIYILERNKEPLKKLLLTGNGRCNYYNENQSLDCYHSHDKDILEQILTKENLDKVEMFYDRLGIIPKIKKGYYYPNSNQAITIKNALLEEVKQKNIHLLTNTYVESIVEKQNQFIIKTNQEEFIVDKVIVGTGSMSYPKTGSDGNGYQLLEKYHKIYKPLPALVPVISNDKKLQKLSGVRCEVSLELFEEDNFIKKEEGELQITDYGLSGICTFNLSSDISRGLEEGKKEEIKINFVPFIKTLISPYLDSFSKKHPKKTISSLLEGFLHDKVVSLLLEKSNINKDSYYQDLSNEEKMNLIHSLRHYKVEIIGTKGFDYSQTVTGGISLKEINPHTLESLKRKNLYVIGELLDMDGVCGGYNLTIAALTGILVGEAIHD